MPYPVLPPQPPAIISHQSVVSSQHSVVDEVLLAKNEELLNSSNPNADNPVLTPTGHENIAATPLVTPPENEPLPDPASTAKSAAALGSPLGVGIQELPARIDRASAVDFVDKILAVPEFDRSSSSSGTDGELIYSTRREPLLVQRSVPAINHYRDNLTSPPTPGSNTPPSTPPFPIREGGSGGLGLSGFGLVAPVSQVPDLQPELLPRGHISASFGPIEVRPQNQRQPAPNSQQKPPSSQTPAIAPTIVGVVELSADRQEFDAIREVFTGEGNVLMRYQGGVISADRIQGNLVNRIAVAEGRVGLRRGQQLFRGQRLVYNLLQDSGSIRNASGESFLLTSGTDLSFDLPQTGVVPPVVAERPLSDRLLLSQPSQVTNPGALNILFGGTRPDSGLPAFGQGGQINRVRFEAENVDFYPRGWTARNVRLTNDPFSPPELEIRADRAVFTRVSPLRDEVVLTRPRLVFDQGFSLPILRSRYVFDRSPSEPPLVEFGYDAGERGGLFVQRTFDVYRNSRVRFRVTPQFFLQRAISKGFDNPAELFGLRARFNAILSPRTLIGAQAVVNNFDLDGIEEKVRASLRLTQIIGTRFPHRLTLEYSFRDRLFNGSLGYQTVQQSIGGVLTSPVIPIAKTGLNMTYQVGGQLINADTDRFELLSPIRTNNRTDLGRFQTSVSVFRGIRLWRGRPLPATPKEGLRYTPTPVVPNVQLVPLVNGTTSLYTNGETQSTFTASISLQGQFGHFSRPFLDYTGFNVRLTRVFLNGESPFYFDRIVDQRVLAFGVTQQIYGPIRVGFQSSINLDTNKSISTDYFVEYSRRSYGITLRYNPDLQLGAILFRVSDFNWNNTGEPFGGSGVRFVDFGILQDY